MQSTPNLAVDDMISKAIGQKTIDVTDQKASLARDDAKKFADIRVKMGAKDSAHDAVSVPSDISEDMWGELPKYQQILY